jgi:hypothetical protein
MEWLLPLVLMLSLFSSFLVVWLIHRVKELSGQLEYSSQSIRDLERRLRSFEESAVPEPVPDTMNEGVAQNTENAPHLVYDSAPTGIPQPLIAASRRLSRNPQTGHL